jgi:hypothetical protein
VTTGRKHHQQRSEKRNLSINTTQQRHSSSKVRNFDGGQNQLPSFVFKIDSLEQTNTIEPLTDTLNVTTDYHQRSKKNEKKK